MTASAFPTRPPEGAASGGLPSRASLVRAAILLAFGLIILQLWRLQVLESPRHGEAAEENRLRLLSIPPPRGVIYDRAGRILASNAANFVISVVEADLPSERRQRVLERLGGLLGTTAEDLERLIQAKRVSGDAFASIPLRNHVPREVVLAVEEHGWEMPGIQVTVEAVREYPDGELLGHVLGYLVQPSAEEYERMYRAEGYALSDQVGVAGVEATYEALLRGSRGGRLVEIEVGGRPLRELGVVPPDPGQNLQLTIDLALQRTVTDILKLRLAPGSSGVAIVMDPRNGELLALASLPGFDPNVFSQPERDGEVAALLADGRLRLFHRALAGQYPPGSTFKLVVGIAALQEGVATRNTRIRSNGGLRVPNPYDPRLSTWFPDWAALGDMNFVQGLALSSNVYFATLAGGFEAFQGLGAEAVARYGRLLGYGAPTGVDLPSEEAGRVPTPAWKLANFGEAWLTGDTYNMAIGQGFALATPLQVANLTNAIANGGILVRPHVGRAVLNQDARLIRDLAPPPLRQLDLGPGVLPLIREGMLGTLDTERLKGFKLPGIRVAGKTGTAEFVGPRDARGNLPTHGWFTAFAPYEDPRLAVTVFIERGGGPADAVPLAMEIFRAYFDQQTGDAR